MGETIYRREATETELPKYFFIKKVFAFEN